MKKKLLIVDDDIFLRNSISAYLIHEGFIVNAAEDVHQALILIQEDTPDLIVADIMMQNLDGYDLIKILRTNDLFYKIPVIFLTAKGLTNDRIIGYDLGCNAYLTKPFNPEELVSIINNLFNNINLLTLSNVNSKIELPARSTNFLLEFLTYREKTVLELVVKGFMNKEIAVKLNLSVRNVEKYVSRLLNKTNTRNRTELAQLIVTSGIQLDFDKGE